MFSSPLCISDTHFKIFLTLFTSFKFFISSVSLFLDMEVVKYFSLRIIKQDLRQFKYVYNISYISNNFARQFFVPNIPGSLKKWYKMKYNNPGFLE